MHPWQSTDRERMLWPADCEFGPQNMNWVDIILSLRTTGVTSAQCQAKCIRQRQTSCLEGFYKKWGGCALKQGVLCGTAVEAALTYIACGDTWVNPVVSKLRENISGTVSRVG